MYCILYSTALIRFLLFFASIYPQMHVSLSINLVQEVVWRIRNVPNQIRIPLLIFSRIRILRYIFIRIRMQILLNFSGKCWVRKQFQTHA